MKRFLAGVFLVALLAMPARAHFVWLLPTVIDGKASVRVVFSDQLAPDDPKYLDKIKQTEVFVLQEKAKPAQLKTTLGKEAWEASLDGKGVQVVGAKCEYGVTARGGMDFLLNYFAKTVIAPQGKPFPSPGELVPALSKLNSEALMLDVVPTGDGVKVLWQGKPLPDAEVTLIGDGEGEPVVRKTNKDGEVAFEPKDVKTAAVNKLIGVRAKHVEAREGSVGDKKYKEVRHYTTLTLPVSK